MAKKPIPNGDPELEQLVAALEEQWEQDKMTGLKLNERPDGMGFYYGTYTNDHHQTFNVNLLPPRREWDGDMCIPGLEPDSEQWIAFVDGVEIGRVQLTKDVGQLFNTKTTTALSQLADNRALQHEIDATLASGRTWRLLRTAAKLWWYQRGAGKSR